MGKKALAVVPLLDNASRLERFHGDATEKPLFTIVTWTAATRKRQLAIAGKKLLELQRFQPPDDARSWFIGNDVHSDGSVLAFTPLDPLFVLLTSAWRQRSRAMALSDVLAQDHNAWLLQVAACNAAKLRVICDVQNDDATLDQVYVTVNESKLLTWLAAKVTRVAKTLAQQATETNAQLRSSNSAFDAKFVLPGQPSAAANSSGTTVALSAPAPPIAAVDPSTCLREAVEIVSDYLPPDVTALLYKQLNLEQHVAIVKPSPAAAIAASNPHEAFQRFDRRHDDASASTSKRAPSAAAAALAKKKSKLANVDRSGMKSMTSFFGKK